jgi:protein-disulfide isomerase
MRAAPWLAVALALSACKQPVTPASTAVSPAEAPDARLAEPCRELRDRLCAQLGAASDVCAMGKAQTKTFSAERCLAMLSRFEDTVAGALRYAEGRRALTVREQLGPHGSLPSLGAEAAPVTLVVFSDFTDADCGRASGMATTLENLFASQARLVFRQFPSSKPAHLAAQASLAAHAQGKFWRFHEVLFGNPQAHDRSALERYAREAGLDLVRFRQALEQRTYAPDVDADIELARKLGITSVPAVFRNGKSVAMPYGVGELAQLVKAGSGS